MMLLGWCLALAACTTNLASPIQPGPYLVVLGVAQDGGVPQAGNRNDPAWQDESQRRLVVSLALVDPVNNKRFLFEATPDIREQLHLLDTIAPTTRPAPALGGIFLTHAHMGHYLGLAHLGHEVMGASAIPVHVMPRFAEYLRNNGPWDQLVRYENIDLQVLTANTAVQLSDSLSVTPIPVPHRQEYSEVVAFRIDGPGRSALFLPDIDSWHEWDATGIRIEAVLATVDIAFLDATFFANGEIPGRDMSGFPHPFVTTTMQRLANLPASERSKVHFIHFNHTNPVLRPGSAAYAEVLKAGFRVAQRGDRYDLLNQVFLQVHQ
ncbi:MAG: pyrroloquinoline quinone biosynthesis protein PqqB [Gammaproteobacteria bacterium]|nr:pyrroloquinoline quinone biosynthesis protein PqqB [Gammaproteobacteria bacterium]